MKCLFLIISILFLQNCIAQNPLWNVNLIPDSLKKDAIAVKRLEQINLEITDLDRATYTVKKVITVLSNRAQDYLTFVEYTSSFLKLEDASITVYDENGKQIEKVKKKEMQTVANGDGLVPEGNVTYHTVHTNKFPITVEFNYELKYKGISHLPTYYMASPDLSIQQSVFTVRTPVENDIRYKAFNTNALPEIQQQDKNKMYRWKVNNQKAMKEEEGTAKSQNLYASIKLAPNKFKLDDYDGDMQTWKSFGYWYGNLKKNLDILPNDVVDFYKNLVANISTEKEKIKMIYQHLQNNFRYVSIQLGIGGFKPFAADFTHQKKYGDCKALSNYMQTCLAALGIKSYQALINAGYNSVPVDADFPSNDFNHVIVCVPQAKDTIWLECTSKINEFGVLGSFTENRKALLITNEGGVLVATPKSSAIHNTMTSNTTIDLNAEEHNVQYAMQATGEFKQEGVQLLTDQTKDIKTKYLLYYLGFKQPDTYNLEFVNSPNTFTNNIKLYYSKLHEFSTGSLYFFNPNFAKIWDEDLVANENRMQDYYFEYPYIKKDTTTFLLQKLFKVETLPKPKIVNFEYGAFSTNYTFNEKNNSVVCITTLLLNEYKIPAKKYQEMFAFFKTVKEASNEKMVLRKIN
jgi:hypothetical protein